MRDKSTTGKRLRWIAGAAVLMIAAVIAYEIFAPARTTNAPARAAVPVTVVAVARQAMPARLETIGTVQPIANVVIKSRLDGYVTDVLIQDGQYVKAGQMMFKLDDRAAKAQLDQARAQLENARQDVGRYKPLVSKEFVSRQLFDTTVANEKALAASVENFQAQLSYYTITAPIDGRVGTIAIKAGNSIKANDIPLATINQVAPIYVGFTLPQSELPGIREAMRTGPVPVMAVIAGDNGGPIKGQIAFFDNTIDVNSGTIGVKAIFPNEDQRLWPGQFVNVSVTERVDPDALTVPQSAVLIGQNTSYVYIIKPDNTAEMRPVKVARTVDGKSVIADGLAEGEQVATDGQLRLTNGSRVDIRPAAAKDNSAS
ncbi:MAG TPA: efflux RND transporter periplasmic adaptor subunit [Stellaceae bacterium]|nr:efflux RND transporter periplasmic adaptor subunit [Stellaceae bacterium]